MVKISLVFNWENSFKKRIKIRKCIFFSGWVYIAMVILFLFSFSFFYLFFHVVPFTVLPLFLNSFPLITKFYIIHTLHAFIPLLIHMYASTVYIGISPLHSPDVCLPVELPCVSHFHTVYAPCTASLNQLIHLSVFLWSPKWKLELGSLFGIKCPLNYLCLVWSVFRI